MESARVRSGDLNPERGRHERNGKSARRRAGRPARRARGARRESTRGTPVPESGHGHRGGWDVRRVRLARAAVTGREAFGGRRGLSSEASARFPRSGFFVREGAARPRRGWFGGHSPRVALRRAREAWRTRRRRSTSVRRVLRNYLRSRPFDLPRARRDPFANADSRVASTPSPSPYSLAGGLDEQVTEAVLHAAFLPFGDLKDVNIPLDQQTQKNRGFGFVTFMEKCVPRPATSGNPKLNAQSRPPRASVPTYPGAISPSPSVPTHLSSQRGRRGGYEQHAQRRVIRTCHPMQLRPTAAHQGRVGAAGVGGCGSLRGGTRGG